MNKILFVLVISFFSIPSFAGTIVVMGDSISAAHGIEVDRGWVKILQKKLLDENKDYTIYNESISGDTSAGGLARINPTLEMYKPDFVLLELGANDGLRGLSLIEMKGNLEEIIKRSQETGAKVLLLSMRIPPNYGKRYIDMFYNTYTQLSEELDIPLVPFLLEDVALEKELMQHDGLHPNSLAQSIIAERVWEHLEPMLKSK